MGEREGRHHGCLETKLCVPGIDVLLRFQFVELDHGELLHPQKWTITLSPDWGREVHTVPVTKRRAATDCSVAGAGAGEAKGMGPKSCFNSRRTRRRITK